MSTVTIAHEHLVRDLVSRVLERLASQEPKQVALAVEALGMGGEARLNVLGGLLLNCAGDEPLAINREALSVVSSHVDRPVKENPSVAAITTKDLVLISVSAENARDAGKALETKLDKQLKAIEYTGAIGMVVLERVAEWPEPVRAKVGALLAKHQHPRLFTTVGSVPDAVLPPSLTNRFLHVEVGEELKPCRRRVFGR